MADVKPLKLVDQGAGVGRLAEFETGDTLPKAALPALSAADVGAATAAQGDLADTAVQPDEWYLGTDKQHTANATGAVTLDLAAASIFDLTLTGNVTLTVSNANVPAGETRSVVVRIRQGATARTLTWWSGITWLSLTTPAAPAVNKIKEYVLSYDGSSWLGREGASN